MKGFNNVTIGIEKENDRIVTVCKNHIAFVRLILMAIIPPSNTSYNYKTAETS